jgi:hypothetical protein
VVRLYYRDAGCLTDIVRCCVLFKSVLALHLYSSIYLLVKDSIAIQIQFACDVCASGQIGDLRRALERFLDLSTVIDSKYGPENEPVVTSVVGDFEKAFAKTKGDTKVEIKFKLPSNSPALKKDKDGVTITLDKPARQQQYSMWRSILGGSRRQTIPSQSEYQGCRFLGVTAQSHDRTLNATEVCYTAEVSFEPKEQSSLSTGTKHFQLHFEDEDGGSQDVPFEIYFYDPKAPEGPPVTNERHELPFHTSGPEPASSKIFKLCKIKDRYKIRCLVQTRKSC